MFIEETIGSLTTAIFMEALYEDANSRRKNEEGKAPRTRRGYAKLLDAYILAGPMSDRYRAEQLITYYNTEINPVR